MSGKYFYFAIASLLGVLTSLFSFLLFLILTIIYLLLLYKYKRYNRRQLFFVIGLFIIFFLTSEHTELNNKSKLSDNLSTFHLQYTDNTKVDGDLLQVPALDRKNKEKLLIRYKIKSAEEKEKIKNTSFYGRHCQVTGQLKDPSVAKNPNAFNYRKYLTSKKVYKIVEIKNYPLSKCSTVKSSPLAMIKELRFNGIHYLEKNFPAEIAALSAALIFGDRSMFDPEVLMDYQRTGIVHLLAISGLHVSLLVGMIFFLGIRIGLTRQFMVNFLLVILPIYAILTGASPSVIRAVLMIFLVLFIIRWKKQLKLSPIDAISITLMIYVLFTPLIILDAGFQLSFSVSFAIILSSSSILPRYQQTISAMVVTSIIAQLAALPILLYHFFEISFISIAANLLYIPLFSFVFLPGLYLLFFIQIIFEDTPTILINIFMKIITLANSLIEHLAELSFAHLVTGRPHWLNFLIYILIILAIFQLWEAGLQQVRKQVIILTVILFTFQNLWNWANPFGEVTMIDVGQGDSILIHYPFGQGTYLIDTGGTVQFEEEEWKKTAKPFEVGRDVVIPFLKGKGIKKLDKLILTHGDSDHIGGTLAVLKEIEIDQILMPSVAEPSKSEVTIIQEANKRGIQVVKVAEGSQWKNKKSLFYVVSPVKNYRGERNSGSIAIIVNIGGLKWFFGGDLDQEGEERIIRKYPNLNIDVLKAGHHGSKTSSSEVFIDSITPSISWISVGERNRYGHPHTEVLKQLSKTHIYRTDLHGAITYRFYNESGTFSSVLHTIKQ